MRRIVPLLLLLGCTWSALAKDVQNPLFEELIQTGIPLPDGPTVKLPPPLFKPGQLPKDPSELLEKAAGRVPVELFLKRTVTAPYSLTIDSIDKADGQRCGQRISLFFIAYGKREDVLETDFLKQLLTGKAKAGNQATSLSPAELKARGIRLLDGPDLNEQIGTVSLSLLDKVQIDGVTQTLRTTQPQSIVYATRLDDRFKDDKEHPNRWRPILRAVDEDRLGPPHPYTGLAGYVVVTELPEPKDALLFEMQFLLYEPPDWFGGLNLLRSKLPIAIQDNVRTFRRKLVRN